MWVVSEAVRKTLQNKPLSFGSKELMIKYTKALVKKKFGINAEFMLKKSILLNQIKTQKKLVEF